MPRSWLAVAFLFVLAVVSQARADTLFVYDLSGPAYLGSGLSGSITFEGNPGDAVPLLDSPAVHSFSFTMDGFVTWTNAATILSDNAGFNGTLGDNTLVADSGEWDIFSQPVSNVPLYLFGYDDSSRYGERWGWCHPSGGPCGEIGFSWSLTLASQTVIASPEPNTAETTLSALGLLSVGVWVRRWRGNFRRKMAF